MRPFEIVPFAGDYRDLPEPNGTPYIVAAADGYYVHRDFHFGRVLVPTDKAPFNPELTPVLWHRFDPKIPAALLGQAWSFFRAVYEKRKSEAMVDITWHPEKGYRLFVPPQTATYGGVNAKRTPEHYNGQIVGTIHSHCNFTAFHSGTDTHDADGHDGLHITLGKVNEDHPEAAVMISVAKIRWENFELADISDLNGPLELVPHPEWWERYVGDPTARPTTTQLSTWTAASHARGAWTPRPYSGVNQQPTTPTEPDAYSIDTLMWRYAEYLNDTDIDELVSIDAELYDIDTRLKLMGIEMEIGFYTNAAARPLRRLLDDDTRTHEVPTT